MAGHPDSQPSQDSYLSVPSSPSASRRSLRPGTSRRVSSTDEGPDELSPLLQTSRSRIRIQSAHGSPRVPNLSRNQSYSGKFIRKIGPGGKVP